MVRPTEYDAGVRGEGAGHLCDPLRHQTRLVASESSTCRNLRSQCELGKALQKIFMKDERQSPEIPGEEIKLR